MHYRFRYSFLYSYVTLQTTPLTLWVDVWKRNCIDSIHLRSELRVTNPLAIFIHKHCSHVHSALNWDKIPCAYHILQEQIGSINKMRSPQVLKFKWRIKELRRCGWVTIVWVNCKHFVPIGHFSVFWPFQIQFQMTNFFIHPWR